jgi:hypothetical protein
MTPPPPLGGLDIEPVSSRRTVQDEVHQRLSEDAEAPRGAGRSRMAG